MATLKIEEEEILTFDVSDEALEIAGTVIDKTNFTFGVCTLDQPGCFPSIFGGDQNTHRKAAQNR
jgi:phosphoribosyl 1,2-cyclic phosphodiesterase